jgi:hypothetical protein
VARRVNPWSGRALVQLQERSPRAAAPAARPRGISGISGQAAPPATCPVRASPMISGTALHVLPPRSAPPRPPARPRPCWNLPACGQTGWTRRRHHTTVRLIHIIASPSSVTIFKQSAVALCQKTRGGVRCPLSIERGHHPPPPADVTTCLPGSGLVSCRWCGDDMPRMATMQPVQSNLGLLKAVLNRSSIHADN